MNKKIAEILVDCGYAERIEYYSDNDCYTAFGGVDKFASQQVNPFADTLEGRRQADTIEDWLHENHYKLIVKAKQEVMLTHPYHGRQKRLDRLKWCIEQLMAKG